MEKLRQIGVGLERLLTHIGWNTVMQFGQRRRCVLWLEFSWSSPSHSIILEVRL